MEQPSRTDESAAKNLQRTHSCLVLLPWSLHAGDSLKETINGAARDAGYNLLSPEDRSLVTEIRPSLLKALGEADVVVGDLTGKSPNVFFEIGVRFASGKPLLLVARESSEVPFDVASHRLIFYRPTVDGLIRFRFDLKRALELIREEFRTPSSRGSGDRAPLDHTLRMARQLVERGEATKAVAILSDAAAEAEATKSFADAAALFHNLGSLYQKVGDSERAEAVLRRSLQIREAAGEDTGVAETMVNLAMLLGNRGEYDQSLRWLSQAEALARSKNQTVDLAATLQNKGTLLAETGRLAESEAAYSEALIILRHLAAEKPEGAERTMALTLGNLGRLLATAGRSAEARRCFDEAAAIFQRVGDRYSIATTFNNLARLALDENRTDEAIHLFRQSLEVFGQHQDPNRVAYTLLQLGEAYEQASEMERGRKCYESALRTFESIGDRRGEAWTVVRLATLLVKTKEMERGVLLFERAANLFDQLGLPERDALRKMFADLVKSTTQTT